MSFWAASSWVVFSMYCDDCTGEERVQRKGSAAPL
jgi:hypothetical protein